METGRERAEMENEVKLVIEIGFIALANSEARIKSELNVAL